MKRSLALLGAMVLALGVVGIGYASWTESIKIHGTITTGELAWQWNNYQVDDAGGATIGFNFANPKDISITVSNTYPGWSTTFWLEEANMGSLPLHFESFAFAVDGSGWAPYYKVTFYDPDGIPNVGPIDLATLASISPKTYAPEITSGISIPVGQTHWSKIKFELATNAPQSYNAPFTFTFTHTAEAGLTP